VLATADKIGTELFAFPKSVRPQNNLEYRKSGIFHFCIIDPEVEQLAKKVVETGGKQRMPIRRYYPGERPYLTYCEDLWVNIMEIHSHSYESTYCAGAYQ
jgi:hypothetical protein